MNEKIESVNVETGEMLLVEDIVQEYVKIKDLSMVKKKLSLEKLIKKLETEAENLSQEDILRLAKKFEVPINSLYSFYMVSLSPYYMDIDMTKNSSTTLNKMLKLVVNGHLVDRYLNNKPISTMKGLYESIGCSKAAFYKAKSELEKKRMIKCLEGNDSFIILFNPMYIRCGNMDETTFFEFEEEIKEYNYIEWLYFKKKYRMAGSLKININRGVL